MKKIITLCIFITFILNVNVVKEASILAVDIWMNNLFSILFPTMILTDLIISSGLINNIISIFGNTFKKIFKVNKTAFFVFLMSIISGTPSNGRNLKILYDNKQITKEDVNKIMGMSIFFNPLFVISLTSFKIWFIILISNIITGFILRNKLDYKEIEYNKFNYSFNLTESIKNSLDILLMILGTITIYMVISSLIPNIGIFKIIITGLLEVSTGLFKIKLLNNSLLKDILSIIFLSFGGLSILSQIKSILSNLLDTKYFIISRILTTNIGIIICILT